MLESQVFTRVASVLLLAGIAQAEVWTVSPNQPADFTEIAPAVAAASSGDTILVGPGSYPGFWVVQKSLSIIGQGGFTTTVAFIDVRLLAADQDCLISGLFSASPHRGGLLVYGCEGSVRLQNCRLQGNLQWEVESYPGAWVIGSDDVVLQDCYLVGADGQGFSFVPGRPGLVADGSRVALFDSECVGGYGAWGEKGSNGGPGFPGIALRSGSSVFLSRSTVTGGQGGDGEYCDCGCFPTDGGPGGAGIRHESGANDIWGFDSLVRGGPGGDGGIDDCPPGGFGGRPGPPGPQHVGPYTELAGTGASLEMTTPSCARASFTLRGTPGDSARIVLGAAPEWTLDLARSGVWITPTNAPTLADLGVIPPAGLIQGELDLPAGVAGDAARWSTLQVIVDGPGGERLGTGLTQVVLDAPDSSYCIGAPNSVSASGAVLTRTGSNSLSSNAFVLRVDDLPTSQPGVFCYGGAAAQIPFQGGYLCVADPLVRLGAPMFASGGVVEYPIDLVPLTQTSAWNRIETGSTWYFQFWYRDPHGPVATSNLSQGLAISFCP